MKKSTPRPAASSHRAIFLRNGGGCKPCITPCEKERKKALRSPAPVLHSGHDERDEESPRRPRRFHRPFRKAGR